MAEAVESSRAELDRGLAWSAGIAVDEESQRVAGELRSALAASAMEQVAAIRKEASRSGYRVHYRRAEAAATEQLARSLEALKQQRLELSASSPGPPRSNASASLATSRSGRRRSAPMPTAASDRHVAESATAEFEWRSAEFERRVEVLVADGARRFAAAAAEVERRLVSADRAQEREERVRERTDAAERKAAERVREAERRLVEVLARIDATEQRTG